MANVDNPRGFWVIRHLLGGKIQTTKYILTTGATAYQGDLMVAQNAGTVTPATADDGVSVIGVASEYVTDALSAGGKTILIYDDPFIVFGVQADSGTSPTAAEVFETANHVAGSGSSTTYMSGHELDASDIATGLQMRILGKVDTPDNAWGEHVDLEVLLVEHALNQASTSI